MSCVAESDSVQTLAQDAGADAEGREDQQTRENLLIVLLLGTFFGVLLVKSEAVSWFRIQEMFRFQSIHMYGILGSAVVVAGTSLALLKRFRIKDLFGNTVDIRTRALKRGYAELLGGIIFGIGWALVGACPGPLYALIGTGMTVFVVALASAVAGAWVYGYLRPRLPH